MQPTRTRWKRRAIVAWVVTFRLRWTSVAITGVTSSGCANKGRLRFCNAAIFMRDLCLVPDEPRKIQATRISRGIVLSGLGCTAEAEDDFAAALRMRSGHISPSVQAGKQAASVIEAPIVAAIAVQPAKIGVVFLDANARLRPE